MGMSISIVHISFSPKENCWNKEVLYTCYGCGCCAKDKRERYKNRVKHMEEMIEQQKSFSAWDSDPKWREVQEKNVRENIRYFSRYKRYYEKKLKEMGGDSD